ncbi:MAG: DUF1266 domain-containing protein [Myxococcota bacterium]
MKSGLVVKLLAVGVPVLIVGAIVAFVALMVAVGVLRAFLARRRFAAAASAWASAPAATPLVSPAVERWAAGAYGLWTGGEDCATWAADRARESLASWYGATDPAALAGTIDALVAGQTGNVAWDQVRALDLLRIGVAAGYLTSDQCWAQVRSIAAALRAAYPSWEALGTGFEAGMHAWQDSRDIVDPSQRGRVQRNLPALRTGVWPAIPYGAPL